MELRVLKYFLAVARHRNITRAAEELHLTQPTLSRQLQDLEEELGTPLFTREKRRMELTEAGLFLKARAWGSCCPSRDWFPSKGPSIPT